jgi:hypothetical protein
MARGADGLRVFLLGWFIANLLGVASIAVLPLILPSLTYIHGMFVSTLIIGLPIGLAQWIALRRVAPISILWVLTISAGLFLGLVVVNGPIYGGTWGFLDDESILSLTAACTTIGLLVGLAQWLLLRGHFAKSLVWILSSAVGLGLGFGLVLASDLIHQSGVISAILVVLVYAMATGLVISWLLDIDRESESSLIGHPNHSPELTADSS